MNKTEYFEKYLLNASILEHYVYTWKEALIKADETLQRIRGNKQKLQGEIASKDHAVSHAEERVNYERDEKRKENAKIMKYLPFIILFVIAAYSIPFLMGAMDEAEDGMSFFEALEAYINKELGSGGMTIVAIIACCWVGALLFFLFKAIKKHLHNDEGERKQEVESRRRAFTAEKTQLQTDIAVLEKDEQAAMAQRSFILVNLRKVTEELDLLYSNNILPKKYRGLVATSTMYEYLNTRRCTEIEGHGGIYDTFEYDIKLGEIITNLNEIKSSLYAIERNQHMLYSQMCMANSHLESISSDLRSIENHSAKIAANTAASALAQQQNNAILRSMEWRNWAGRN